MASIPFYLKTNGKWQVGSSPMAVGGSLRVIQEGESLTFYGSGNNVPIIEKTHVTDIAKNADGDTYATVEEFEEASKDFFLKASADSGGDLGIYVKRSGTSPKLHDVARYKEGMHILWDRWDGEKWEQIGAFGNSMRTDRFITFATSNKLTGFYHKTDDNVEERMIGPALTKPNTTVVGMGQNELVFAATELKHIKFETTTADSVIQPLNDETTTTDLLEFKSTQTTMSKVSHLQVHVDTANEVIPFRVIYYGNPLRRVEDIVWESGARASYMSQHPDLTIQSDGTAPTLIKLPRPYFSDIDNVVYVSVITKEPVIYNGHTFANNGAEGEDEFILWMAARRRAYTKTTVGGGDASIFVTDITSVENVSITTKAPPNHGAVERVSLASKTCRVFVEWDRTGSYEGLATVNGENVHQTGKSGATYTGYADISGEYDDIIASYAGTDYTVFIESLEKPTFTAIFTGVYPSTQTALKDGDMTGLEITTDALITAIEIGGTAWRGGVSAVPNQTGTFTAPVTAGNPTVHGLHPVSVRIRNAAGTWSNWLNDESNEMIVDNRAPVIHVDEGVYPSGQQALKDAEVYSYPTVPVFQFATEWEYTATSNLTAKTDGGGVTRASGDYELGTYTITATNAVNALITVHNQTVRIANAAAALVSNTPVQVRSGVGAISLPCEFTQDLLTPFTSPTITATDADTHSLNTLQEPITFTNLAGIETQVDRDYFIKGFARKTLTINHPASSVNVGVDIVTPLDISASGQINFTPPYPLFENRVANVGDIQFVGDYHCAGRVVTFSAVQAQEFDYSPTANITLNIEEA